MKLTNDQGVSIVAPDEVVVLRPVDDVPVFHGERFRQLRLDLEGHAGGTFTTFCGIEHVGVELPTKHAVRFARACLRCWPRLREPAVDLRAAEGEEEGT